MKIAVVVDQRYAEPADQRHDVRIALIVFGVHHRGRVFFIRLLRHARAERIQHVFPFVDAPSLNDARFVFHEFVQSVFAENRLIVHENVLPPQIRQHIHLAGDLSPFHVTVFQIGARGFGKQPFERNRVSGMHVRDHIIKIVVENVRRIFRSEHIRYEAFFFAVRKHIHGDLDLIFFILLRERLCGKREEISARRDLRVRNCRRSRHTDQRRFDVDPDGIVPTVVSATAERKKRESQNGGKRRANNSLSFHKKTPLIHALIPRMFF